VTMSLSDALLIVFRKCVNNKAFFLPSTPGSAINQFCVEKCELITTCGEVTVPETHLEVHVP
jgi:hypothetical protein